MVKLTEEVLLLQSVDSSSVDSSALSSSFSSCANDGDQNSNEQSEVNSPLACLRKINCWGSDIDDISIIEDMTQLEVVILSSNSVSDLSPLSKCKQLTQLALRRNKVSDLHQLIHLKDLPKLKTLWLLDNPVAEDEQYRKSVIRMLPQLNKLDGKVITEHERSELTSETLCNDDLTIEAEGDQKVSKNNAIDSQAVLKLSNGLLENGCQNENAEQTDVSEESKSDEGVVEMKKNGFKNDNSIHVLSDYANDMAKTSIMKATQEVRVMGAKLYSAPLLPVFKQASLHSTIACDDLMRSIDTCAKDTPCESSNVELEKSCTVRAIELLLETLSPIELQQIYASVSSKLSK
ncbi:cilia- and flagella-associated protein 410-like [Symsagittifera roscoffensis]|uniref:cilia- and flagella-associated protein 410-like n=1 Tax=Symsagittifera roscoffensis TaxID=84072 RepID=UPI00307C14AC